ncbi:LysM peptidoglycan-binding domain-containing protein [Amycolatopsis sp. NPDC059027]|uniref:LysM peptidoglycan-binding domain-containing protein n=1 Tax=Amycolatopsis sp. NPDC059027 TaxID=3346709 RepID=UPI00366C6863
MSILAERGVVRPVDTGSAPPPPRVRVSRGRRAEALRPPTRARVVAGRRAVPVGCATPRRRAIRWPWLAALAVATCLVITGLGLFAHGAPGAAVPARTAAVSVERGDTLSSLAERFAPSSDPGAVVDRIKELNRLDDAVLVPGLLLTVPVADGAADAMTTGR